MCWSDIDKAGTFESSRAADIGRRLISEINSVLKPRTSETGSASLRPITPAAEIAWLEILAFNITGDHKFLTDSINDRIAQLSTSESGAHMAPIMQGDEICRHHDLWTIFNADNKPVYKIHACLCSGQTSIEIALTHDDKPNPNQPV